MKLSRWDRVVSAVVVLLLILNAYWVIRVHAFPTMDGWAHLQTAHMLIDGPDGVIYCPNPGMVPNRVGHLVLGVLQLALPGLLAERVMLALTILGIGMGLWMLVRAFGGRSPLILLVLPFTYNILLVLGFHNFLLGVGLAFVFAALWVKQRSITWTKTLLFLLASYILYYTHTMAVALFYIITGLHELWGSVGKSERRDERAPRKRWSGLLYFTLSCLPALVGVALFDSQQEGSSWEWGDPQVSLARMHELSSLVLYARENELPFTNAMQWILIGCIALVIWFRVKDRTKHTFQHGDLLLIATVVLFALNLLLPDALGYASYVIFRLQLLTICMLIGWLAMQALPKWAVISAVLAIMVLHKFRQHYIGESMWSNLEIQECVTDAATKIPEGSIVLPVSYEGNWLLGHIGSLLAAERDITLLENYECGQTYFPLIWCTDLPHGMYEHVIGRNPCLEWLEPHVAAYAAPRIDHVVVLGYRMDTIRCDYNNLEHVLELHYRLTYNNKYARVYEGLP